MIVIKANTNKQSGLYFPLCWSSRSITFSFTESCKYNSGKEQSDLHKLFGIGVFHLFGSFKTTRTKKWWELHKWLSIRVGWRYNIYEGVFEITDYCYIDGIGDRDATDNVIVKVKVGDVVKASTYVTKEGFVLEITANGNTTVITKKIKMPICLFFIRLRAYVGSGFTTKKDMIINEHI